MDKDEVKVLVTYNCGCGFKTERLKEAVEHVSRSYHTMMAGGLIKPRDGNKSLKQES